MKSSKKVGEILTENAKNVDNKLLNDIKNDEKLSKDKKNDFLVLAAIFMEDFSANLNKTSIELNEDNPFGIDIWYEFLNYPCVRSYLTSFKNEKMLKVADAGIMEGDTKAVKMKDALSNQNKANNANYIIVRLPEKVDFTE